MESIVNIKPEIVKIDRHITNNIDKDKFKKSIVKFITAFCKENDIISIAEGVETKEELGAIKDLQIDAVQGYYLYKPVPYINQKEINASVKSI